MLLHSNVVHISDTIRSELPDDYGIPAIQQRLRAHGFVSAIHDAGQILAHLKGHSEARKVANILRAWFRFSDASPLTADQGERALSIFEENFSSLATEELRREVIKELSTEEKR